MPYEKQLKKIGSEARFNCRIDHIAVVRRIGVYSLLLTIHMPLPREPSQLRQRTPSFLSLKKARNRSTSTCLHTNSSPTVFYPWQRRRRQQKEFFGAMKEWIKNSFTPLLLLRHCLLIDELKLKLINV